jgi:hypothetical protein
MKDICFGLFCVYIFNYLLTITYASLVRPFLSAEYNADSGIFSTWQLALFRNVYAQLVRSPLRTLNASEASVFFIPYDAGVETYIYRDGTYRGGGNPLAKVISKYLNKSSEFRRHGGADHFLVYSASLLSQGISSKLKRLFKMCKNSTILTFETNKTYDSRKFMGFSLPYLQAVPYPSIYHWQDRVGASGIPVLAGDNGRRVFLIALLASTQTNQPAANKFRHMLMQQCMELSNRERPKPPSAGAAPAYDELCWGRDIGARDNRNNFDVTKVGDLYRQSVFCLMPPGDTNTRRGIFDALLCGCIPVLFEYPGATDPINPADQYSWHFTEEEIKMGFVFFDGRHTNYMSYLANMDAGEIAIRQQYLKRMAFKSQYSLPAGVASRALPGVAAAPPARWAPPAADGVAVILEHMFEKVKGLGLY